MSKPKPPSPAALILHARCEATINGKRCRNKARLSRALQKGRKVETGALCHCGAGSKLKRYAIEHTFYLCSTCELYLSGS